MQDKEWLTESQSVVQLLQCYLRAAELEMRATEEPLKSDLDVAVLKAQVLGRIEGGAGRRAGWRRGAIPERV